MALPHPSPFFLSLRKNGRRYLSTTLFKDGLTFSFPGNWNITGEESLGDLGEKAKLLNVESPGDAIVIICVFDYASNRPSWSGQQILALA